MTVDELVCEIEERFREGGVPSLWIKLFKDLKSTSQRQLLQWAKPSEGEVPIFGGVWREASKQWWGVARERVWLLVTSSFVYWGIGSNTRRLSSTQILDIKDVSPKNRHFAARGYYGLRRFTLVLDDRSTAELPSKGGGAACSVWCALALLGIRRREGAV